VRIFLRNDQASRALSEAACKYHRGVVLQVLGAGTCWFDTDRSPLENTDSLGIPTAGSSLTAASGPVIFQEWPGEMWLRGSIIGVAVEITPLWGVK
jgi:hypothetical protein